jgi:hypothetical protein
MFTMRPYFARARHQGHFFLVDWLIRLVILMLLANVR